MKITYEPFKEVIIKECVGYKNLQDLLFIFAQLRASGQPVSLNWAKGVVFALSSLPPSTDQLVKEYLDGRLYIANASFALMPDYKDAVNYVAGGQQMPIPVINASDNVALCEIAEWLKAQK
jgi:hypothetical protein